MSYKSLVEQFISSANSRSFDDFPNFLHEGVIYRTFSLSSGKYVDIIGRKKVTDLLKSNFNSDPNLRFIIDNMIQEHQQICLKGKYLGRSLSTSSVQDISSGDPFELDIRVSILFEANKIKYFEIFANTFEILRIVGRVTINMGDEELIRNYLKSLKDMGIIPGS